jgi:hypothetical protein
MQVNRASSASALARAEVVATDTASRVTPASPNFKEMLGQSAAVLLRGAESAVRSLPMPPLVAASVRAGTTMPLTAPHAPVAGLSPVSSAEGVATVVGNGAALSGGANSAGTGIESALAQSQEMNLYMLELQERVSAENRAFTTYSNVLKARHETVKNAIGNIR